MRDNRAPILRAIAISSCGLTMVILVLWAQGCKKQKSETTVLSPTSATTAAAVAVPPPPAVSSKLPGITSQNTENLATPVVAFATDHPIFTIARDYNQVLALPVRNLSGQTQRIVAKVDPWDEGMIGDFGAEGGVRPLELAPGQTVFLPLQLYAQDAIHPSYRNTVTLVDAQTGSVLARGRITVFVTLPVFSIETTTGEQDQATLARLLRVRNTGQTLTDFSVHPDGALVGYVQIKPSVEHTLLEPGAELTFKVVPVLDTDYSGSKGPLRLSGAGQTKSLDVDLPLPPGKHVFVATSFSTTNSEGTGSYCTNNPNTNSPISGPADGKDPWEQEKEDLDRMHNEMNQQIDDPNRKTGPPTDNGAGSGKGSSDDDNEGTLSKMANWLNSHMPSVDIPGLGINTSGRVGFGGDLGPVGINGSVGATDTSDPTQPFVNADWNVTVDGHTVASGQTTVGINQNVQNNLDPNNPANPTGSELNQSGTTGGARNSPRRLAVREAYEKFRRGIAFDNEPEAMCDMSPGDADSRLIFQIWHSGRWTQGAGRQILLRIWDGLGKRALSRTIALTDPTSFCAWPTVLFLPDRAAVLAVWEKAAKSADPPSLEYRVGGKGFGTWSPIRPVPGSDSPQGNYDPQALMMPDGRLLILWQQGRDTDAHLMLARSNKAGEFVAVVPSGLPEGVQRPVARLSGDGALCLVFQSPPEAPEGGVQTAVFAAVSRDRGTSFQNVTRLSPAGMDAGEADLLIDGDHCDTAFRVGPDWGTQIYCVSSDDSARRWFGGAAVTDESVYAEFPVLVRSSGGEEISYYGDLRANHLIARAGSVKAARSGSSTTLKRFVIARDKAGTWSSPRRVLTHFPSVDVAWLEAEFSLRFPRRDYKPHDVTVLLNHRPVLHLHNAIPEGTYLVGIPAGILAQDSNGLPANIIGLRTVHMNPGHYLSAAHFRLQARQAFSERLVVADNQAAADAEVSAESDEINHRRADVGIFARADENPKLLPDTPSPGQIITLPLSVANLGEHGAGNVKVRVYAGNEHAGMTAKETPVGRQIDLGNLAPLDLKNVDVTFPYGGADMYSVIVSSDAGDPSIDDPKPTDFDLENNVYRVSFVTRQSAMIQARPPSAGDFVADLDDDPAPANRWRIIDPRSGKDVAQVAGNGIPSAPIPPGKYQLAMQRYAYDGKEIMLPGEFERKAGEPMTVTLRTAIELQTRGMSAMPWRWEVVEADHPEQVIQFASGEHPTMLLPPGDYFVEIDPTQYDSQPMRWPGRMHLEEGQHLMLKIDSGVAIPPALAAQQAPWRWSLFSAGDGQVVQYVRGAWGAMSVPPGEYLWGIQRLQYHSEMVRYRQAVKVEAGKMTALPVPAKVECAPNSWGSSPYSFSVYDTKTNRRIASESSDGAGTFWLAPGDYRLGIQPTQYSSIEMTWMDKVHIQNSAAVKIKLDSGIDIEPLNAREPMPYELQVIPDGKTEAVQRYAPAQWGSEMLPPGLYRIAIRQRQYGGQRVVWPNLIDVKAGELFRLMFDSGLRLTNLKADEAGRMDFQIVSTPPSTLTTRPATQASAGTVIQNGNAADALATVWIPPGVYSVQLRRDRGAWQTAAENVTVGVGGIVDVRVNVPLPEK